MDQRLSAAINEGKEIYKVKSDKNLLKARKWVNKNLFKLVKSAESKGCNYCTIYWIIFFHDVQSIVAAINEIKGVSAKIEPLTSSVTFIW